MSLHVQGIKYISIGVYSNVILYCIYIFFTKIGIGYKVSMTSLYLIGMLQTFFLNKYWTFGNNDKILKNLWRYLLAYGAVYLINLSMLFYLVDILKFDHVIIQGILIVVLALFLFVFQKYWIFSKK